MRRAVAQLRLCMSIVSLLLLPGAVEGAPILYSFSGTVGFSIGSGAPAVGTAISGTFTYDPDGVLIEPLGGNSGTFDAGLASISATYDGTPFLASGGIQILMNNVLYSPPPLPIPEAVYDQYLYSSSFSPAFPSFNLLLLDADRTQFDTFNSLPAQLPVEAFEYSVFLFVTAAGAQVRGLVTFTPGQTAAIPEPASLSLLGLGLAALAARKRRQRRHS